MTAPQPPLLPPDSFQQLEGLLRQAQFDAAADHLFTHLPENRSPAQHEQLTELLARFPAEHFDANPDLLYLQSILLAQTDVKQAATQLLRAIALYREQGNPDRTAACYFELIRTYQQQEDFRTAYLYVQEAEELLHQITDPALEARLYLRLAELCPDLGRLHESVGFAQQALARFRRSEDPYNQFKTHILLSILQRQLGDYHEAEAQLEMGRRLQQAKRLGEEAHARVLSSAAHLAWHRGEISEAIRQAEALGSSTRKAGFLKFQVYSALLLGNLYRAQRAFATAHRWYSEARHLVERAQLRLFLPWVDLHEGWLHVLTGDYLSARKLIHKALTTPDRGQMMSFTVHLALLNLLEGHFPAAETLLRSAQPFYQRSGDELATAVIHLYLAYTLHSTERPAEAASHLQQGMDWLADHHIWCFPYWWHPQLVAHVCGLALRVGIHTVLVEHMVAHHIGATARPILLPLADDDNPAVAHRTRTVLALLAQHDGDWLHWVAHIEDEPVRQVLEELLERDYLRKEKLPELKRILTTAQQRGKPNPVLIAVFGLYLYGATLNTIATQLQRAPKSIRNYVSTIYQIFNLPPENYSSLQTRRQHLYTIAQQHGFLGNNERRRDGLT